MEGKAYDDWLVLINYTDPKNLLAAISQPAPEEGNPDEGYGLLNVARDAAVFDMG